LFTGRADPRAGDFAGIGREEGRAGVPDQAVPFYEKERVPAGRGKTGLGHHGMGMTG
jgi:hypothetical protein